MTGQYDYGMNARSWSILHSTGSDKAKIYVMPNGTFAPRKEYLTSIDVFDGSVHQLVFTWDNGTLKLFVDGIEDTSPTKSVDDTFSSLYNSGVAVTVGCYFNNGTPTNLWDGMADELALYASVLTPDRIAAHYRAGIAV